MDTPSYVPGPGPEPGPMPEPREPARVHRVRIRVVLWLGLLGLCQVVLQLLHLQIDPDLKLTNEGLRHVGYTELHIPRGDIVDRNGTVLARERRTPSLSAQPYKIADPYTTALRLSALLDMEENDILDRLLRRDANGNKMRFVWVRRWLTDTELDRLNRLEPHLREGLTIEFEPARHYPQGEVAAHVLGFANRELRGAEGIELIYDEYLRSIPGKRVARVDARRNILESLNLETLQPSGGDTVHLTLDVALQHRLEQELDKAVEAAKAEGAMGLIMDPRTGAVLAMACRPAFDPNEFYATDAADRKNRALVDVFEPGSVFKIVTAAAALEMGLVTPSTLIDCEGGAFNPYGHRINDYHKLGVEPFWLCFAESSNIAMIKVAAQLGPERLAWWIRRFGFGAPTSRDFRGESRGIFRPVNEWSRLSMGSLPMGQEIGVTMPQLAQAFSVIANGGFLVEPYLVEKCVSRAGETTYARPAQKPERILSPETAAIMQDLCYRVVTDGTATRAQIAEYRVGGKTGTAQIAPYHLNQYNAVFCGFAPLDDPRLVAVIVVHKPGVRERWGGWVCAPVFREVARDYLVRTNCPLDPMSISVNVAEAAPGDDADTAAGRVGTTSEAILALDEALDSLKLRAHPEDSTGIETGLPDFSGLTKREALARLRDLGLPWDLHGDGWVIEQDPPAGAPLDSVALCRLVFGPDESTIHEAAPTGPADRVPGA